MIKIQLDKNKIEYDHHVYISDINLKELVYEYNGIVTISVKLIYRDGTYSIIMPKIEYIDGPLRRRKFTIRSHFKHEIQTAYVHFYNNDDAIQFRLSYQN